jgi:hypothetical protein
MTTAYLFCAIITAMSAFTSFGFSVAAVNTANAQTRNNAMYAASRSVALAIASIVPFLNHSQDWLVAVAVIMVIVQIADAGIGAINREPMKTYGPAFLGLLNFATLIWLVTA